MTSKLQTLKKWRFPHETVLTEAAQAEFPERILVRYLIKQQKLTSKEQT